MVKRNPQPDQAEWQNIKSQIFILFQDADCQNNNQREHANPLVPAKHTGRKVPHIAEI
jgi:hypothetical protein